MIKLLIYGELVVVYTSQRNKSTDIGECTRIDLTGWPFKIMKKFYYVGETLWANAVTSTKGIGSG